MNLANLQAAARLAYARLKAAELTGTGAEIRRAAEVWREATRQADHADMVCREAAARLACGMIEALMTESEADAYAGITPTEPASSSTLDHFEAAMDYAASRRMFRRDVLDRAGGRQ